MSFHPHRAYNELPLLPPQAELETRAVLKKLASARGALGELKGVVHLIPNQTILLNTLILEEARDSSEIENIITTRDKLYKALVLGTQSIDPATKEVLRYREALWNGFEMVKKNRKLTTRMIIEIQKRLMEKDTGIRKLPGTVIGNRVTGRIIYTPPDGEKRIRSFMKNLEDYIRSSEEVDPLIKMGVVHYQFEAIHPFYDGNGRTGRITNVLYLLLNDLLDLPILYLSSYIIRNKPVYYSLLRQVTSHQAWEEWILFMLEVVEQTSRDTITKVNRIKALLDKTIEKVRKEAPKIYSKELVELLFHQPYCKIKFLVDAEVAERKTAAKYLDDLSSISVLKKVTVGKENVYLNSKLYELFTQRQKKS